MHQDAIDLPFDLATGETLDIAAGTEPYMFALTSHGVIVASEHHTALDLPTAGIRRVELNMELGRPPTVVLIPHAPHDLPWVLSVPHEELDPTMRAVRMLGDRLRAVS